MLAKSNSFARARWGRHELPNRFEDDSELIVISGFERLEFVREIGMGIEGASESHKRAHDFDVDLDGSGTP